MIVLHGYFVFFLRKLVKTIFLFQIIDRRIDNDFIKPRLDIFRRADRLRGVQGLDDAFAHDILGIVFIFGICVSKAVSAIQICSNVFFKQLFFVHFISSFHSLRHFQAKKSLRERKIFMNFFL